MTNITIIPPHIPKEAKMLRNHLVQGSFNTNELVSFLERVEQLASPSSGKKRKRSPDKQQLFDDALKRLTKKK
ncbi:MAG: hypothetical protein ABI921_00505 [Panacibacter sp.]